jgi:hypothetical protein
VARHAANENGTIATDLNTLWIRCSKVQDVTLPARSLRYAAGRLFLWRAAVTQPEKNPAGSLKPTLLECSS